MKNKINKLNTDNSDSFLSEGEIKEILKKDRKGKPHDPEYVRYLYEKYYGKGSKKK